VAKTFTIDGELLDMIEKIRKQTGREQDAEVLRDALQTYSWVVNQYDNGFTVISESAAKLRPGQILPFNPFEQKYKRPE